MDFEFKTELFEYRATVMEILSAAGYWWLSAFSSVDIDHQDVFLEVDGIRGEDTAWGIARTLAAKFAWGIRAYQRDYSGEWVVLLLVKGSGFLFGGGDDGQRPGRPSTQTGDAKPEKGTAGGEPAGAHDPEEEQGAVEEERDGEHGDRIEEPTHDETSANEPDGDQHQNLMLTLMGGKQMNATPPEELLRRFAIILQKLSQRTYVPLIYLPAPARTVGQTGDADWDGMVDIIVRLRDVRISMSHVRRILPLLRTRREPHRPAGGSNPRRPP